MDQFLFSGLKVLDVGSWIAGPVAATMLADFGAEVIKIERPQVGDQYRILSDLPQNPDADCNYMWQMDARNKKGMTLNLKTPEGMAVLHRMIDDCDVYITNQPFPLRRELQLEYEDVKARNPGVIYASLTAYGEKGPERDKEGFDLVAYWARTGLMDLVRDRDARPSVAVPGMGDHPSAVSLYASIVTALLHRERTGEGSMVHTSLLGNGVWSAACIAQAGLTGGNYKNFRLAREQRTFAGSLYETRDNRWLQLTMIRTPEELVTFFTLLGIPDLLDDPRFSTPEQRFAHGEALHELTQARLLRRSSEEWIPAFKEAGLNVVMVGRVEDLADDPMVKINGMAKPPTDPESPLKYVIDHPVNVDAIPTVGARRAPELGEHTDEVLLAMGYTEAEISNLKSKGIV